MNDSQTSQSNLTGADRDEMLKAIFAQMVIQQANMAMMLLGKTPHPQSGETLHDLEAARMFIDQLQMLEVKTKGNLSKEEEQLLKQSLMALRMAYVEEIGSGADQASGQQAETKPAEADENKTAPNPAPSVTATEDESKKKFSKKY